ncbi:helix-turn-helix domain-containing protein [Halomonas campisalis]|uniref:Helix-turn-helix domain-containing protein n=1 Tax=Billgrantia campisalis TaxID=74661 RepID=A0ABS9PBZ8_9GAMM|nr:helix-turn-helix domain-containing protein [Halomonas campisalis]MCG6659297.1 helix-turn-helix domain-containing protein [Halomonas campisalis]MDR5864296.1 helix-turn-helix domain-containing protein [Halomonas campisalis]
MSKEMNQSVSKAMTLFEALLADGFKGKRLGEIAVAVEVSTTTAWRLLKTLEAHGWVVEVPVPGSKGMHWKVSSQLVTVAHAYQRDALRRIQGVQQEYRNVTGEELNHG